MIIKTGEKYIKIIASKCYRVADGLYFLHSLFTFQIGIANIQCVENQKKSVMHIWSKCGYYKNWSNCMENFQEPMLNKKKKNAKL